MKKIIGIFSQYIMIVSVLLVVLLSVLEIIVFNPDTFNNNYTEKTFEKSGFNKGELEDITTEMLLFLRGDREDFDIKVNEVSVFTEKEQLHMNDVQALFINAEEIRIVCTIIIIIGLCVLIYRNDINTISRILIIAPICTFVFGVVILVLSLIDFNNSFDVFHDIFFDNELWILSKKNLLIIMLPKSFFRYTAIRIIGYYLVIMIIILYGGVILKKYYNNSIKMK